MKVVKLACGFIGLALGTGNAVAGITYSCSTNVDATFAGTCNTLNTTIAELYSPLFTDANASIYIQYGSTGLASTLQIFTNVTYTAYASALQSSALLINGGDANDAISVASLGSQTVNPVSTSAGVALSSALATAPGLANIADSVGVFVGGAVCTLGAAGCYNAVETLSNTPNIFYYRCGIQGAGTYDLYSAVEHETNEVLGTVSCIAGNGGAATITTSINCRNGLNGNPSRAISAADLFRYSAPGVRSYIGAGGSQANGSRAYFSNNSGKTNLAAYNNSPNGADYDDWNSSLNRVKNAYGSPGVNGVNINNDGGSEIAVLDAVGYNLVPVPVTVPERGTIALFGTGLGLLAAYKRRRAYQAQVSLLTA